MKIPRLKIKVFLICLLVMSCVACLTLMYAQEALMGAGENLQVTGASWVTKMRDTPLQVPPGAVVEVIIDSRYTGDIHKVNTTTSVIIPRDATLDMTYEWNGLAQPVNGYGTFLSPKDLSSDPPKAFSYVSDGFGATVEDVRDHLSVYRENNRVITANISGGQLYYEAFDPDLTAYYGDNLTEYMVKNKHEAASSSYHQSHFGNCAHNNNTAQNQSDKRDKRWGIVNTEEELKMEILLGKYWNELYFNKRMEGFRSPHFEYNAASGTKTPLRSLLNGVLDNAGFRYISHVTESVSGSLATMEPLSVVPSFPQITDSVTVSADPQASYTSPTNVHNVAVGAQRITSNGIPAYSRLVDRELASFNFADVMKFVAGYTDRHFTTVQNEIPYPYITGDNSNDLLVSQANIPVSFSSNAFFTTNKLDVWAADSKQNSDWIRETDNYITANYPDAKNVTQKDILDYYTGHGTYKWMVKMPDQPGRYRITCLPPCGCIDNFYITVKEPEIVYNEVQSKVAYVKDASEVAAKQAKGFTDVMYTIKGETGQPDITGITEVINAAKALNMGVYANISVFKDTDMHTTTTIDYTGQVVSNIAEPIDSTYRQALKDLVATISSSPDIKGIMLDAEIPTANNEVPTNGYSDAMIAHFEKFFGPPPAGVDPTDPTSENDPLHWSIYSSAVSIAEGGNIDWLAYNIRKLIETYVTTGDLSDLMADEDGVKVVDWMLCKTIPYTDGTGVSSWDEIEAWGEFRRYMIADFINEVAGGSSGTPVYAVVTGAKDVHKLLKNAIFGTNTDPVELADPMRRPSVLPDIWNSSKSENIAGIIYTVVDAPETSYITSVADIAQKVDYWVAKGGNSQLHPENPSDIEMRVMQFNKYRPLQDTKVFGVSIEGNTVTDEQKYAATSLQGQPPAIIIVNERVAGPVNISCGKPIYSSSDYSPSYPKDNANDCNEATAWGSGATDNAPYIYIDLGKEYLLNEITIKWYNPYYASKYYLAAKVGTQWVTATMTGDGGVDSYNVTSSNVRTRYVGIQCLEGPNSVYAIKEFEILGTE